MGKAKPKLKFDIEFEWVDVDGSCVPRVEYKRKSRLRCCADMSTCPVLLTSVLGHFHRQALPGIKRL